MNKFLPKRRELSTIAGNLLQSFFQEWALTSSHRSARHSAEESPVGDVCQWADLRVDRLRLGRRCIRWILRKGASQGNAYFISEIFGILPYLLAKGSEYVTLLRCSNIWIRKGLTKMISLGNKSDRLMISWRERNFVFLSEFFFHKISKWFFLQISFETR